MKKLKVLTVVGTRPAIIRLSRVLARLDVHCEHVLVPVPASWLKLAAALVSKRCQRSA